MHQNDFSFEITQKIPHQLGRAGIIHTPHGDIQTPAFMCVGTRGQVPFFTYGRSTSNWRTSHVKQWLSFT